MAWRGKLVVSCKYSVKKVLNKELLGSAPGRIEGTLFRDVNNVCAFVM